MFGFGKKKAKPTKASGTRKATPKRATKSATGGKKAAPVRKTKALCIVCRERTQTDTTTRICGRKRCAAELRQRSQHKPAPAKATPRRAPAKRRPAAPRTRTAMIVHPKPKTTPAPAAAAPKMSATEFAAWFRQEQSAAQATQIRDWNKHHRQWRDEIVRNAAGLNQAAAVLSGPDRAAPR